MSARHDTITAFVRALGERDYPSAAALASPDVPHGLTCEAIAQAWTPFLEHGGALEHIGDVITNEHLGGARFRFELGCVDLRVVVDESGILAMNVSWADRDDHATYEWRSGPFRPVTETVAAPDGYWFSLRGPIGSSARPLIALVMDDRWPSTSEPHIDTVASELASLGLAVLEARVTPSSTPVWTEALEEEACLRLRDAMIDLQRHPRSGRVTIDPARVHVLGYGTGARIATRFAGIVGACAGIVLVAPVGRAPADVIGSLRANERAFRESETTEERSGDGFVRSPQVQCDALMLLAERDIFSTTEDERIFRAALDGKLTVKRYPLNHGLCEGVGAQSVLDSSLAHDESHVLWLDVARWVFDRCLERATCNAELVDRRVRHPIPHGLDEAVAALEARLGEDAKAELASMEERDLVTAHFGLGRFVRNQWLWSPTPLVLWFRARGTQHPDAMSSEVVTALWRKLHAARKT